MVGTKSGHPGGFCRGVARLFSQGGPCVFQGGHAQRAERK